MYQLPEHMFVVKGKSLKVPDTHPYHSLYRSAPPPPPPPPEVSECVPAIQGPNSCTKTSRNLHTMYHELLVHYMQVTRFLGTGVRTVNCWYTFAHLGGGGHSYIMNDMDVCQGLSNSYLLQTKILTKFWTLCRQMGEIFQKYIP